MKKSKYIGIVCAVLSAVCYGTRHEKSNWGLNRGLFNSTNGQALPALYEMSKFKH